MFDDYTKMNTQVCHIVKMLLRLKVDYQKSVSDYDDPEQIYQWSRAALVVNSSVAEIKYLVEFT